MSGFVEQLFKMSLTASIVIVVVMLIRFLMRKFPKKYLYLLWAAVWFRLLCPVSIKSKLSIFNLTHAAGKTVQSRNSAADPDQIADARVRMRMIANVRRHLAQMDPGSNPAHVTEAAHTAERASVLDPKTIFMVIWVVIAALILGYAVYHIVRLRRKLTDSYQLEPGVFESPYIDSPIAIGIIKPEIYIPTDVSSGELEYLIEHERAHIKRGDLIFKMFAVIAVALHWFNPLAWIAFALFCRDMEMGCDEMVLEKLGDGIRKAYSLSLVTMAEKNHDKSYLVTPTSFGKNSVGKTEVKMRIENILHFKKSSSLVAAVAGVTVIGVGLTCGLNAYADTDENIEETAIEETTVEELTTEETAAEDISSDDTYDEYADTETEPDAPASQSDYMTEYPDWDTLDFNLYDCDDHVIDDMSVIEDDDLRELAQYYYDQGFYINNPETTQYFGFALGNNELMFKYGFHADSGDIPEDGSYIYKSVDVYKMDEDLFNYYFIECNGYISYVEDESEYDEVTDDGTVIYASFTDENFQYTYEFNRDTQIAVITCTKLYLSEGDYYVTPDPITNDLSLIEDETLRDIAQSYMDQDYVIWNGSNDLGYFIGEDAHYETAFSASIQGENSFLDIQVLYMDQELFDAVATTFDDCEIEYTIEDDGTIERITNTSSEGYNEYLEFNRDTGIGYYATEFF